jgi:hypothetical protein
MRRLVLAGVLVVASMGVAVAGGTRKVKVESDPPGATVYIDDPANGVACDETPCTIDAPIGSPTIILRRDKYQPVVEELDVPKGKKPLSVKYKLKGAFGTLVFDSPKGATIMIGEEERGKVPAEVKVDADAHHVVLTLNGKKVYDDFIDVEIGAEVTVKPKVTGASIVGDARDEEDEGSGGDEEDDGDGGDDAPVGDVGSDDGGAVVRRDTTPGARPSFLTAGVAFDVGFRQFTYDMAITTDTLRDESEGGQVMAGPAVEFFPMRMFGASLLRGLSLFARAQFGLRGQTLTGGGLMGTVTTFWGSYEGSLRYRWMFGAFGIEASSGYVRDQMRFNATDGDDVKLVPDAEYQSIRIGGKLSYDAGQVEPYVAGENRIVLSGGVVEQRFDEAKATGLKGALGAAVRAGPITARVEGAIMNYSWTFAYDGINDEAQAKGATDAVKLISILVGYTY